jgi:hypothetical protein
MIASLKSRLRQVRFALVGIVAALSTALVITPARAAGELSHLEGGTIAAVCVIGMLAFALAFEIWHLTARRKALHRPTAWRD